MDHAHEMLRRHWKLGRVERAQLIFLAHNMVELHQMAHRIGLGVWSAIATFHEIASASCGGSTDFEPRRKSV